MVTFRFWARHKKDPNRVNVKAASKVFADLLVCRKGGVHQWTSWSSTKDAQGNDKYGEKERKCLKCKEEQLAME